MNTIKPLFISLLFIVSIGNNHAEDKSDTKLLGGKYQLNFDAEINYNIIKNDQDSDPIQSLKGSYLRLTGRPSRMIKAVILLKIENLLDKHKLEFNANADLEDFIDWLEHAYVVFELNPGNKVRALTIGKSAMPFSSRRTHRPLYEESELYSLQNIEEVFGVFIDLDEELLAYFDQIQLSSFAADKKSFHLDSASVKVKKYILDNWMIQFSHAEIKPFKEKKVKERRSSLGFIGFSEDGDLVAWIEGLIMNNSQEYAKSDYAVSIGFSKKILKGTDIVLEYMRLDNELSEYLIGAKVALTKNWLLGLQVGHKIKTGAKNAPYAGLTLTRGFESDAYPPLNEDWIFKNPAPSSFENPDEEQIFNDYNDRDISSFNSTPQVD